MITTPLYHKIAKAANGNRLICNRGGTSSSKTYSTLQFLYTIASLSQKPLLISVVSETFPHLKKGAMKDFFDILKNNGFYKESNHNKTEHKYKVNQSIIEFFSADSSDKVHGPRRDILYLNEGNHIRWGIVEQLEIRTKYKIFLDWNPSSEFWYEEHWEHRNDCQFIQSTYKDNTALHKNIVQAIESRKPEYDDKGNLIRGDENWWRVYGLGEVGSIETLIYPSIKLVDSMPDDYKKRGFGLDFGYTNDPTALIECILYDGGLYFDENLYSTELLNTDIIEHIQSQDTISARTECFADSAEPKSIAEIRKSRCINIKPVAKGKDSILQGIDVIKRFPIHVTKTSTNLIKEFRNYQWIRDKNEVIQNKPIDNYNHGLDAARYWAMMTLGKPKGGRRTIG